MNNKRLPLLLVLVLATSCDIYRPQKTFRLAVPEKDYFYNIVLSRFKPYLENNGIHIKVVPAANIADANRLVAQSKADLCFVNNNSVSMAEALGADAGKLRTLLPVATRLLFAFSKQPLADTATARDLLQGKRVGLEATNDETRANLEQLLERTHIQGTEIVDYKDNPDVIIFWGTFYGERATRYRAEGWQPFSFKENMIEFLTLNDPALSPYTLPAIPGDPQSRRISTVATETVLVTNQHMGENAIYKLADVILQHKAELIHQDIMYRSINENFDKENLLFPLHEGTLAFLRRDEPTFLERYADAIALVLSLIAVLYGAIQTVRTRIARRKKDQVDQYFLEFLEIRQNPKLSLGEKINSLDSLFQRAVEQMTNEKLEKSDFHIFSRLIQQELTMLRFK